jgi:DNA polymerase III delta prime subunit
MSNDNEFLWCEKYRPQIVFNTILPESLKSVFTNIVESGELPNMLFSGSAGVGKTTVAKALCEEMCLDYIVINGSDEGRRITSDVMGKIGQFASSVSLGNGPKVVIIDEADYLNAQSVQPALRFYIEKYSDNCRFILTCNLKNRIIEPIHSRCSNIDFTIPKSQKPAIASQFFNRIKGILADESVTYDENALVAVTQKFFPDFRRTLNELQKYAISGSNTIDAGILTEVGDVDISDLMKYLKAKDFSQMRKWVVNNIDQDTPVIIRKLYNTMSEYIRPETIPAAILILAEYQFKDAWVADKELNMVACLTEVMSTVEFK